MPGKSRPIRILFLSAEADPFIKVGGLGDVAGSLPAALRAIPQPSAPEDSGSNPWVDIRLVIPFHGAIRMPAERIKHLVSIQVPHTNGPIPADVYLTRINQLPVYLIAGDPIHPQAPVYSSDLGFDAHKFTFFSLAALEAARTIGFQPDIIHANDWHTSAAVYWLALHRAADTFYSKTASLLTIHNLPFLGVGASFPLTSFYLPPSKDKRLPEWAQHLPLPLGILSADHITTVSPSYAKEILTPEFGSGLDAFLRTQSSKISGILNGIDLVRWNPANDPHLSVFYSKETLNLRQANKAALLNELGFLTHPGEASDKVPLIAMVSRMDYQKGLDLAVEALYQTAYNERKSKPKWRAVILGTGLPELEESATRLERRFPDHVRAITRFDGPLSHRIYAGADMFLMPSRYEPCGLSQLIAMRYGCVPIARETGGLADTIMDYEASTESTGFLFNASSTDALFLTIQKALGVFNDPLKWKAIQFRGMDRDFSWQRSAREYLTLYLRLIEDKRNKPTKGIKL
jgi:starch synthase